MARLKDLKPIENAKVSGALKDAISGKGAPIRKTKPRVKARAKTVQKIKPKPVRTIADQARRNDVQAQVDAARAHLPRADTGDILKGTHAMPKHRAADSAKDELEGHGKAASLSTKLANVVVKHPQIKSALKVASIIPGLDNVDENLVKDAINLPAQAIPSLYVPIAAGVEALRGKPARLRKFGSDIKSSDPIYAAGEAVVKGVSGDTKGASKAASRAVKLTKAHPGFTAAEVIGAKGTLGRGITRAQRLAGKHPGARPSAILPGTSLVEHRTYSKDAFTRAKQKRQDRRATERSARLHAEADALEKVDPGKHADRIEELHNEATHGTSIGFKRFSPDPSRMTDAEVRRRAASRVAVNETTRRENRSRVALEVQHAITPKVGRARVKPTAATTLHAQAITDGTVADLAKYKAQVAGEYKSLPAAGRKSNRELQKQIQKAIDSNPDPAHLRAAATAYRAIMAPRTQALVDRGMLPAAAAQKAPLVPYAVRHMGAKVTEDGPVHPDTGEPIRTKEIRAHMKARAIPEPAYVTQAPGAGNAFFVSSNRPQAVPRTKRTGGATARGTFEGHPRVLAETAARTQGLIDASDGFTATIKEFAHKPTLGKLKDKKSADAKARELSASTGVEYQPVRVSPFGGRGEQLQNLLDEAGEDPGATSTSAAHPINDALHSAYRGEDGPGPWALIPKTAADEFAAHAQRMGAGPIAKVGQLVGQSFRRTVLATSPSWVAGNVTEAALRSTLAGAGPKSYRIGRDVLKKVDALDSQLGQELRARAVGGGHFASADNLHVRRGAEQFAGTQLEPIATGLHKFWQSPGPRQAAHVWNKWTDLVFRQLNGRVESAFQTAMLGRALRESPLMPPDLPRLSARAVDEAARGMTDTNAQAALAKSVERMYGKYNGFTADMRWGIAMYTPFIAWSLNAVKFIGQVLPQDHPTTLAVIAASEQATAEWRKSHGLDLFMGEGRLPGFLQGSIPLKEGGHQRAPFRYTPFGFFGDPLENAQSSVLPQLSGVMAAFKGEDWKGAKLRDSNGQPVTELGKAKAAAQSFTEATVPLLGIVKRVSEKGPGALNPAAPVKPAKAKVRSGSSGSVDSDLDAVLSGGSTADSDLDAVLGGGLP
jgi:hypothetical protein